MRRLLLFCAAFSAAVFLVQLILPVSWALAAGGVCLAAGGACAVFLRGGARTRAWLTAAGLALGFVWSFGYFLVFTAHLSGLDGQFTPLEATVIDYPAETQYGCSVIALAVLPGHPSAKTRFYLPVQYADLQPGDTISAMTETRVTDGAALSAITKGTVAVERTGSLPLAALPNVWGRRLDDVFRAVFPAETRGLVMAVITGNTEELGALDAPLRRTGLYHAVSVSGMHVAFLAGLITALAGGNRRRSALLCIPVIVLFVLAVGSPPAAIRAAILYISVLLAPLLKREGDTPTALAFALFLLLLHNPYAAADIGLQLSFAATAGIVLLAEPMRTAMATKLPDFGKALPGKLLEKACRAAVTAVATTFGAMAFTVPLVALYFNTVSLISPLASVVTMLALTATFLGGLIAGLLGLLWLPLGQGIAFLVSPVIHYLMWVVPALAGLPLAAVTLRGVFYRGWLVLTYAIVGVTFVTKGWKRPVIPAGCCLAALLAAAVFTRLSYRAPLTVTALDVGQGQSIALLTERYTAVVDCGGSLKDSAGDIAASYLQDAGIHTVDVLALTHYHADHANGVAALMRRLEVLTLLLPDVTPDDPLRSEILTLAAAEGARVVFVDSPAQIDMGSAMLTVFPPLGGGGDVNEEGLTVLGTAGDFDVLITGDMNTAAEAELVSRYALPDIELLVAGHHGSKYATSADFLAAVRPEYSFLSVGYNTYGHPTPETMTRLDDAGAAIYRTDMMGTVSLTVNAP